MAMKLVSVWTKPTKGGPAAARGVSRAVHVSANGAKSFCGRPVAAESPTPLTISTIGCATCFKKWGKA